MTIAILAQVRIHSLASLYVLFCPPDPCPSLSVLLFPCPRIVLSCWFCPVFPVCVCRSFCASSRRFAFKPFVFHRDPYHQGRPSHNKLRIICVNRRGKKAVWPYRTTLSKGGSPQMIPSMQPRRLNHRGNRDGLAVTNPLKPRAVQHINWRHRTTSP